MKRKNTVKAPYKKLDDVPYELTEPVLIRMQKLERGLSFILQNLVGDGLTDAAAAEAAGYTTRYFLKAFRDHFGMPFKRYVTKLRIRQAARDIRNDHYPKGIGSRYGFSTLPSFTRAFRREIGISPREYYYGDYTIPDMPFPEDVEGLEVRLEYRPANAFVMQGTALPVPMGNDTYLMDALAFPFSEEGRVLVGETGNGKNSANENQVCEIGIWWYDPSEQLRYLYGGIKERFDTVMLPEARVKAIEHIDGREKAEDFLLVTQVIQGGNYAVFSYPRPEDDSEINLKSRILSRFIFKEWVPVNQKVTNTLGFTYEVFDDDRVYIYLPLQPGMEARSEVQETETITERWARYIDEHIGDDLTTESLAYIAGYSTDNYRDIFQLYYGVTPAEYVKSRRRFIRGEGADPKTHDNDEADARSEIKSLPARQALLREITSSKDETIKNDILGLIGYWFTHDFDELKDIEGSLCKTDKEIDKIYIWGSDPEYEAGRADYKCYIGCFPGDENVKGIEGFKTESIPAGKYVIFYRHSESDIEDLEESFVVLHRYAFGTWIQKHRARTDLTRRTFVVWRGRKLYFYVPLVG